jgi:superfamily II DNA or RNA helicase
MITLRDYQETLVDAVRDSFRAGKKSPLVVSPTGSGKTVLFAYISDRTAAKGNKVLILVHRQELVDQTVKTLRAFGVDHGVIAAGRTPERWRSVQVASVQTLVRRLDDFRPDLIVIDEAHHGTAGSWRKVIDHNPQARVLGVTATPERLDGKGLGEVFDDLLRGPEVSWLIDNGHLSRPKYYAPPQVADIANVHIQAGDFNKKELADVMDKKSITGDAVEHYSRICPNQPAVAFCASVAHAQHVAEQFTAAGFAASTIDGKMDKDHRREVVKMLGDGRLKVLTSCEIINEGFDLPIVSAAILLRPTMSLGLHLQQIGRVLRVSEGKKNAFILDHVGNLARHGFAEDVRDWSLEGRKKGKKSKDDEPSVNVRQCPSCYACHPPEPKCPECGHVYEIKAREIEVVEGTLEEVDVEAMRRAKKIEQGRAETLEDLIKVGVARGYKNPKAWAIHVFNARQGKHSGNRSEQ